MPLKTVRCACGEACKAMIFFAAALYLFGFSLNGVNVNGAVDFLIPVERALCFGLSMVFFGWFVMSCRRVLTR